MATKRTAEEAWKIIEAQAREDEIDQFLAKSDDEVDAELRAHGVDPDELKKEGAAFVAKLGRERDRLAWQVEAAEGLAREQARVDARPAKYRGLARAELQRLVLAARSDARFTQPVAVMFRNRKTEEASDEELVAILEEIDSLAERGQ